jgi:hypothetical protein
MTSDHYMMELPTFLFPDSAAAGNIVTIRISRHHQAEKQRVERFMRIQQLIHDDYTREPTPPRLVCQHTTQSSAVFAWEDLKLHGATVNGIDVLRNGQRVQTVQMQRQQQRFKISSLQFNTAYEVQLVVRTSAGPLRSNVEKITTATMQDLTTLRICLDSGDASTREQWRKVVEDAMGAQCTDGITLETTHLVVLSTQAGRHVAATNSNELSMQANGMNLPIVSSHWLEACQDEGKLMPTAEFFVKIQN